MKEKQIFRIPHNFFFLKLVELWSCESMELEINVVPEPHSCWKYLPTCSFYPSPETLLLRPSSSDSISLS